MLILSWLIVTSGHGGSQVGGGLAPVGEGGRHVWIEVAQVHDRRLRPVPQRGGCRNKTCDNQKSTRMKHDLKFIYSNSAGSCLAAAPDAAVQQQPPRGLRRVYSTSAGDVSSRRSRHSWVQKNEGCAVSASMSPHRFPPLMPRQAGMSKRAPSRTALLGLWRRGKSFD